MTVPADKRTYWRNQGALALVGMGGVALVLWLIDSPHIGVGAVGAIAAIAVRGAYLASEALGRVWHLTDRRLILPDGRSVELSRIETVRQLLGDVQVITREGDKHLIAHIADAPGTEKAIEAARFGRWEAL
ncbi:hypothetical protein C2I36_13350 [Rhodobacteraceae bacterium WD3A24]|nr:hypothetical protein C2I36_13350 [Rhodobacteraceae bacterium WD3A24]